MRKKNIALISPGRDVYSETFIKNHKAYFYANVYYYYYGMTELENMGKLSLSKWENIIRKIKRRLRIPQLSEHETAVVNSFKKHRIDKVYAEYGPTGVEVLSICKKLDIPLIVNFHGYDASVRSVLEANRKQYEELFNYAESVIVVSREMRKRLIALGARPSKVFNTPCAPDDIFFGFNPCFSENSFIAVGRFVDKKAPYYTIFAFLRVLSKFSDAKLYLCGDGLLYNVCINIVKYFKLSDNVIFLGSVSAREQRQIYERAIGFVQHSITAHTGDMEGTPVGVLEASAAGLPVIATEHAGIPDVVLHGKTGFLVEEHDVDQMAEYMILLLENKEYAKTLGKAGRDLVKSNYTMRHHIGKINKLLYK